MRIKDKAKHYRLLRFFGCVVFYLFFCFRYGVVLGSDSRGYIEMISAREPVYPLLLALFRALFGQRYYLQAVVIAQNVLAAFAAWYATEHLWRRFCRSYLTLGAMYAIHAGVAFLCQYAAERGSIYSSTIMTEGITISLWLVAMTLTIEGVLDWDKKKLLLLLLLLCLLTDTRKQMAVGYLVLAAAVFFARMGRDKKKIYVKRLACTAGGIVLSLVLALLGTRLYNYALRGSFSQNTRDMNLVLTTSLYVADREDAALIGDSDIRELFTQTLSILWESKSNYSFAPSGLRGLSEHYEEHFDIITVKTTGPLFLEYARRMGYAEGMEAEGEADRASAVIVRSLFADNLGSYAKVYLASVVNGVVNTIAKRGGFLDIYALLAFVCLWVLCFCLLRKKESRDAGMAGVIVGLALCLNVAVAAAFIFCQSRYMIYNMPLFYMAGLWLLETILRTYKKQNESGKGHTA